VARRTEADITPRVAAQLYAKTRDALPRSYRQALHLPARLHSSATSARREASKARSRWDARVAAVDRVVRQDRAQSRALRRVRSDLVVRVTGRRSPPEDVTQKRVQAASSVPIHAASEPEIELMRIGRKKIVLHIEKLVSARIVDVTRPLVHAAPILKPVLQAFVASADATVQARIERAYDRVMSAQLSEGAVPQAKIEHEAEAVVTATSVTPPVDRVSRQTMRPANRLSHEFVALQTGRARLADRVAQARAEAQRRAAERAEAARLRREQQRSGSLNGLPCIPGAPVPRGYRCVPRGFRR
jgi:hypothetical protein